MRNLLSKINAKYLTFAVVCLGVLAIAAPAFAVDSPAAVTVEGGASSLSDTLLQVATYVLPLAAGILAIVVGWRMVRRFLHG
jgi:hypothetical protein